MNKMKKNKVKEFFKPTTGKIILGIVITIVIFMFSYTCIQVSEYYPDSYGNSESMCGGVLSLIGSILVYFWIIPIIIAYILSCLIINEKNKIKI
jgi:uncharacterized membrane protein